MNQYPLDLNLLYKAAEEVMQQINRHNDALPNALEQAIDNLRSALESGKTSI